MTEAPIKRSAVTGTRIRFEKKKLLGIFDLYRDFFIDWCLSSIGSQKESGEKTVVTTASRNSPLSISAKFSGWKQYLNVSFKGVSNTKDIAYELIYASNGVDQGAGGRVFWDHAPTGFVQLIKM